jgi:hypothetical protein
VLCGKKGEADEWLQYCKETGREQDVIRFGINEAARFNMIGYEASRKGEGAGQVANIVRFIMELRSVIFRQPEGGGGDSDYWRKQEERVISHAVTVIEMAGYEITPQAIHDVIMSAPIEPNYNANPTWKDSACVRAIQAAFPHAKTDVQKHDLNLASDFWLSEWPKKMADRTRGSILVGAIGALTAMNTGIARELFASRSNTNPREQIEGRKIVICDFPPDEFGDLAKYAGIGLKVHWQNEILRRTITNDSPVACIWADENSLWISERDATFLSRCRSFRGSMVNLCQSMEAYHEILPGDKGKASIEALMANYSHKLTFALGNYSTAEWMANLCGKELQQFQGGGVQYAEAEPFRILNKPQYSANFNEHYEWIVQPGQFLNGFRTGSPVNKFIVDALLVRSGSPFSNGLPIIKVQFDQRG